MIIILTNSKKYSSPLDNFEIYSKLESKPNIHLYWPKFKYAFESDFTEILKDLGINLALFETSNFGNLCQNEDTYVDTIFKKLILI